MFKCAKEQILEQLRRYGYLDGARLLGGEGSLGEGFLVHEDRLLCQELLQRVEIDTHLRDVYERCLPPLAPGSSACALFRHRRSASAVS